MSSSINWQLLESQYFSNEVYQNDLAKMVKIIDQDVSTNIFKNVSLSELILRNKVRKFILLLIENPKCESNRIICARTLRQFFHRLMTHMFFFF